MLEAVIAHERVSKGSSDGVVVMEGKGQPHSLDFWLEQQAAFHCPWLLPSSESVLARQTGPCLPLAMGMCSNLPDSRCLRKDSPGVCKDPFQHDFGPGHAWHTADTLHE